MDYIPNNAQVDEAVETLSILPKDTPLTHTHICDTPTCTAPLDYTKLSVNKHIFVSVMMS